MKPSKIKYNELLDSIGQAIETARQNAVKAVNTELVKANWEIGRHIVEFEQHGHKRAEYGSDLLARLSKDLKLRYGKGFGSSLSTRATATLNRKKTVFWQLSYNHFLPTINGFNRVRSFGYLSTNIRFGLFNNSLQFMLSAYRP